MHSPRLRVTERCLVDDLGLDASLAGADARDLGVDLQVIREFVSRRGTQPDAGEWILKNLSGGKLCSLHVGRHRAVTQWDPANDTVWLLGYDENHRDGAVDDSYNTWRGLHAVGKLRPTTADVARLYDIADVGALESIRALGMDLLAEARSAPGREACRTIVSNGNRAVAYIDVVLDSSGGLEEGWVGVTFDPEANVHLLPGGVMAVVSRLLGSLPEESLNTLTPTGGFPHRPAQKHEIIFHWDGTI